MSRVQALKRFADVFSSSIPKRRHWSHLPYFGYSHVKFRGCKRSRDLLMSSPQAYPSHDTGHIFHTSATLTPTCLFVVHRTFPLCLERKDARRVHVCIITISLPLATCCSPYHDTSPFRDVATIDILIFTSSSGGVAEKFANPSFLDALRTLLPPTRSCGSRCSSMCPPMEPGWALSACWISQLCKVLAQAHAFC